MKRGTVSNIQRARGGREPLGKKKTYITDVIFRENKVGQSAQIHMPAVRFALP